MTYMKKSKLWNMNQKNKIINYNLEDIDVDFKYFEDYVVIKTNRNGGEF